ncbi:MAG TPA: insulinase family protein [Candidatus Kapabacteria bacterium]|jgi:zinc protease|nr:insulinase family protein [Candidatus Kapabacteria bacterium]
MVSRIPSPLLRTLLVACATTVVVIATTQRSAAQPAAISVTRAFAHNNINTIVSPAANELVSVIIGLEGGLLTGETQNPALGEFTSDLITSSGSHQYPKEALRRFVSRTSTSLYGQADARGISYRMTTTLSHFDEAFRMLASVVMNPLYDTVEFRNIMQQRIAAARRRWSQPEGYAQLIADSLIKLGHPVLSRITNEADIASVTIPMMREFMGRITERTRMFVVVVGNVTPEQIREKLSLFDELPRGKYTQAAVAPLVVPKSSSIEVVDLPKSPTTYVTATFVGPVASGDDYWPMVVGMSHLRSRLFEEVRTKRNLSYAPQSYLTSSLGQGIGAMAVSAVLPDSAVPVMLAEFEKMRRGEFTEKELEDAKAVFITNFYMSRMTNSDKATALYNAERNTGRWERAFGLDLIEAVRKEDVVRVFNAYPKAMQFGVVGPAAKITRDRYRFDPKP